MIDSFILRLFIAIFAVYRLSQLLPEDDGPFFIFRRIREFCDNKAVKEQEKTGSLDGIWSNINEGITCPYCMGMYISIFCCALLVWPTIPGDLFLLVFALAGGQTLLQRVSS